MDGAPIRQARMFGIMRNHALLEAGNASIVHDHVGDRDNFSQSRPVRFFADVQLFEPAADRRRSLGAGGFVDVGEYDDGAFVMEALGDGAADSTCCAGDDAGLGIFSLGIRASKI